MNSCNTEQPVHTKTPVGGEASVRRDGGVRLAHRWLTTLRRMNYNSSWPTESEV